MEKDYSWVVRGKQRKKIIKVMNKPKIPTEIKENTKLSLNNTSGSSSQIKTYFFILLGATILVGLLVGVNIIISKRE